MKKIVKLDKRDVTIIQNLITVHINLTWLRHVMPRDSCHDITSHDTAHHVLRSL